MMVEINRHDRVLTHGDMNKETLKMSEATQPNKILTTEGLIVRDVERINRIHCDARNIDVAPRSWQCSRWIRREFNLVSYKMFFVMRNPSARRKVRQLLDDVREEADVLESMARKYELPDIAAQAPLHLRLVSNEAEILIDAVMAVDKAIVKLKAQERPDDIDNSSNVFFAACARLKKCVLDYNRRPGDLSVEA
jgi:hypothetical protein